MIRNTSLYSMKTRSNRQLIDYLILKIKITMQKPIKSVSSRLDIIRKRELLENNQHVISHIEKKYESLKHKITPELLREEEFNIFVELVKSKSACLCSTTKFEYPKWGNGGCEAIKYEAYLRLLRKLLQSEN